MNKKTKIGIITTIISVVMGLVLFVEFSGLANATTSPSNIVASANVQGTCYISLSSNAINFGNISPDANVPTNFLITDYDNGGNIAANILVDGTNWIYSSNNLIYFGVSNTLWSPSSQLTYSGNVLSLSPAIIDTKIVVPAPTSSTPTSNSIYFGLAIPAGTEAGIFTQTITVENSC